MSEFKKRTLTSLVLMSILFLSFIFPLILYILLFAISLISLDEIFKIFKKIFIKNSFAVSFSTFLALIYICYFALVIILFLNLNFEIHKIKILFLLSITISTDIGGYIFGKIIGGKKVTKISPNKTYSGIVGSFLFSFVVGYLFYNFEEEILISDINLFVIIFIISLISQIGDLIVSSLKRKAKLKDTGSFLPGHGGILDRIDGILLALPIGILLILN